MTVETDGGGDFCEGVSAITVIVDGGWSKRSHRHSYNAKSGVGIIIGYATRKLLHIGVRNKYCTACTQGIPFSGVGSKKKMIRPAHAATGS